MSFVPEHIEVTVSPEAPYVGDTVTYTVKILRPEGAVVSLPEELDLSPLSLNSVSARTEPAGGGLELDVLELRIGIYTLDDVEVPSIELDVASPGGPAVIVLEPREIEVRSLVAEIGETPHELEPPDKVWVSDYTALWVGGAVLAMALLLALAWRMARRFRKTTEAFEPAPPPPRPPHDVALEALRALRDMRLVEQGAHKEFFFRLSEIVRGYVGGALGFESLELTTTELVSRLRSRRPAAMDLDRFAAWCALCDMVKFARYRPSLAECEEALSEAFSIVERTRPSEEPSSNASSSGGDTR